VTIVHLGQTYSAGEPKKGELITRRYNEQESRDLSALDEFKRLSKLL